jgi:hypothetical protein
MVTPMDDPNQQAALAQFRQDIYVYLQRMHVAGKLVFVIMPVPTCDAATGHSAADGVIQAIGNASTQGGGFPVGVLNSTFVSDPTTNTVTNTYTAGHLGADCRTPDAWLNEQWINAIATPVAAAMKAGN